MEKGLKESSPHTDHLVDVFLCVDPLSDTSLRDLFFLVFKLKGDEDVYEQLCMKKWFRSAAKFKRLYMWARQLGLDLPEEEDIRKAKMELASFFTEWYVKVAQKPFLFYGGNMSYFL